MFNFNLHGKDKKANYLHLVLFCTLVKIQIENEQEK